MKEKKWYVLYVKPNHEKKVEKRINDSHLDIAAFCPTRIEVRVWSDRKKKIEIPLLSRIVFIQSFEADRAKVFDFPGTVNYLYDNGEPGLVKENEITHLKRISENPNIIGHEIEEMSPGDLISLDRFGFDNEDGIIQKSTKNNIWVVLESLGFVVKLQIN
ncbi:transcription termination/antitermination NusG family protein [Bizionia sp.]|uniref:transcription termination/antitermination NusG family protein n=1 Tax=Bizionia sp. TaxID=1954480 RepID=UPI003A950541